jgi:hypothetical protein
MARLASLGVSRVAAKSAGALRGESDFRCAVIRSALVDEAESDRERNRLRRLHGTQSPPIPLV